MSPAVSSWTIAREPRTFSVIFGLFCRLIVSYLHARQKFLEMYRPGERTDNRAFLEPRSTYRKKRRPRAEIEATSCYSPSTTSSQYRSSTGMTSPPSFQQRAYEEVKRKYFVPQTTPHKKSLSNDGNLVAPPSYRGSMTRMGETGAKRQDPYYYASRDHLARTGSYYGTYSRPKYYQRPHGSSVNTFLPDHRKDVYSPSYGIGFSGSTRHARRPASQYNSPVIVASHDNLEEAKPLITRAYKATFEPTPPPVRAISMSRADVSLDQGNDVIDMEQKADDIKRTFDPPVRVVTMGQTEVAHDEGLIDLIQHADTSNKVFKPPVRAVEKSQTDVVESAADVNDFHSFGEVALDLDLGAPVRAVKLGQDDDFAEDFAKDMQELRINDDGGKALVQRAAVLDDAEITSPRKGEAQA